MQSSIHNSYIFFAIYSITCEETKVLSMLQESLGCFTNWQMVLNICKPENRNQASVIQAMVWQTFTLMPKFQLELDFPWLPGNIRVLKLKLTVKVKIICATLRWQQPCMFAWLDKQLHVHQKYFVDYVKPGEVTYLCWSIHQWRKKVFSAAAGLNHQVLVGCRCHVAGQIIRCWPVTEGCSHSKNAQDSRLTLPSFPKVRTTVSLMSL